MEWVISGISAIAAIASALWAWRSSRAAALAEHRLAEPELEVIPTVPTGGGHGIEIRASRDLDSLTIALIDDAGTKRGRVTGLSLDAGGTAAQTIELVEVAAGAGLMVTVWRNGAIDGTELRLRCEARVKRQPPWVVVRSVRFPAKPQVYSA